MTRLVCGLALAMFGAGPSHAMDDAKQHVTTIVGERPAAISARILSTRPALSPDGLPAVTAASGVVFHGGRAFIVQDDSTLLAVANPDGTFGAVRLFPAVAGADRFLDSLGNKRAKPDAEVIFALPARAGRRVPGGLFRSAGLVVMGSGSLAGARDRIAVVDPGTPRGSARVVTIEARSLYARLRAEPRLTGPGGQLNLEGGVVVDRGRALRLFQRGTAAGAMVASVDLPLEPFLAYLAAARRSPDARFDVPFLRFRRYDLGATREGSPIAITDATMARLPGARELVLYSAIAEDTGDVTRDGTVSATTVGVELPAGRLLLAPLLQGGKATSMKVEGLAVRSVDVRGSTTRVQLLGVVDPDATDPATPSTLVEIELTLQAP